MEPVSPGLLGTVMIALLGSGVELPPVPDILLDAPAEHRPLRLSVPGRLIDVHPSEIRDVRRIRDQNGAPALTIRFAPDTAEWLASSTEVHFGEAMEISICGEAFMSPAIMEPIVGGELLLSGNFIADELDTAAHIIAGQVGCDGALIGSEPSSKGKDARRGGSRGD